MEHLPDHTDAMSAGAQARENDRRALLDLLEQWKQAHYAGDAEALLAHDAETVLYVREGEILPMSHADLTSIYAEDMRGATYQTWEYTEPPLIRIAGDGSVAWIISRARARRTKLNESGVAEAHAFLYAGTDMFEKRNGAWTCVANVSTFTGDAESRTQDAEPPASTE
jgi:ketosteroid isomerase-like protein